MIESQVISAGFHKTFNCLIVNYVGHLSIQFDIGTQSPLIHNTIEVRVQSCSKVAFIKY